MMNDLSQYREDARGRLVPVNTIKAVDQLRDQVVREIAEAAKSLAEQIKEFKCKVSGDISAFVALSVEQHGVKVGGKHGAVTLHSFDGRYRVVREVDELIALDERLRAAKSLVDACITDWSSGAPDALRVLVHDAFQVDPSGRVRVGSILALRRYQIDDERWRQAMHAIADSIQIVGQRAYVRVYERDDGGRYQLINLSATVMGVDRAE